MTDFNQKPHDTDVGSHGGQSRQMMEVLENQEFGSIRLLQEAGKLKELVAAILPDKVRHKSQDSDPNGETDDGQSPEESSKCPK